MYDALFPRETALSLSQSMQRPVPVEPQSPGVFDGFGGALADVLPHAALTAANAWSDILDAYGKASAYAGGHEYAGYAQMLGRPVPAKDMEQLDAATIGQIGNNTLGPALRQEAKKWAPNPAETGVAGQIVFGVGESLTKAGAYTLAGPAAPVLFGADVGINRADELKDQGVDGTTANWSGALSGAAAGVGLKVPAAMGATRLQSAAIGATVNPALNVAETGGIRLLLQHADYDNIARQYQPFDPLSLTVAAVTGGAFGAAFHSAKPGAADSKADTPASQAPVNYDIPTAQRRGGNVHTLTPDEHAAALTMHETHVRDDDLLTPLGDDAAAYAGRDAQLLARQQLDAGQTVNVGLDVPVDPAVAAGRVEQIAQRLNHGDTLLGQPLDFGGRTVEHLETEYAQLADSQGRNLTDDGHLIDTDLVRELSPEYRDNRLRASDIHEAASALTKELYARALARPMGEGRDAVVQFLAGGGGSGKSTARKTLLGDSNADIRMDGTLANLDRARANIEAALASGRDVDITYVYRSSDKAAAGVIQRAAEEGRPVPIEALAEAHEKAAQVVKTLAREYHGNERVDIQAIWNDGDDPAQARFIPLEEVPHVNRTDAESVFRRRVEEAHERGEIPDFLWRAFVQGVESAEERKGAGSLPQAGPQQHAQDALKGGSGPGAPPAEAASGPVNYDIPTALRQQQAERRAQQQSEAAAGGESIVDMVVDAVSHLFGQPGQEDANPQAGPQSGHAGPKADTPEQATAFDLAARDPDALFPSGEKDADGNDIYVRAADLVQLAADLEKQAKQESGAFGAAVNCALRYHDET